MRTWTIGGMLAALLMVLPLGVESASAFHLCRTPACCVPPPACAPVPLYRTVVEMVPYTVMQTRTRLEHRPITCTVNVRVPVTQIVERQRVVCRPQYSTTYVQRPYRVCRPVYETTMVAQQVTICRPVTTTRQVAATCMQPVSRVVTVPVMARCGGGCGMGVLCGRLRGGHCGGLTPAGCVDVVQTCYQPVPVLRTIYETRFVNEVVTRQVPVTTCRMVWQTGVQNIPIVHCRMVREVVTERIPVCVGFRCVPQQVTRFISVPVRETVPVTCYRPVTRVVPCEPPVVPVPQSYAATPQGPAPRSGAPSKQGG
jgi:hypothetical protein